MADTQTIAQARYTEEHEWVKIDGDLAVVGITAYAASQLGDITYVELPQEGDALTQMGEMGVIESVKAAADLYAPVAGTVAEANTELEDEPQLVNSDPYGQGWMVKLKDFDQGQFDQLMDEAAYKDFVGGL